MTRVAIHLDPLLSPTRDESTGAAARAAAVASLAGADAIVARLPVTEPAMRVASLKTAFDVFDGMTVLACPLRDDSLHAALELRPDLVLLTRRDGGFEPMDPDDLPGPLVKEFVQSLRASQMAVGVFVSCTVPMVKAARQMGVDTVALDARSLRGAMDLDDEVEAVEALQSSSLAADKLELSVLVAGDLERSHRDSLSTLDRVDGVILGEALTRRALLLGLPQAVREWRG